MAFAEIWSETQLKVTMGGAQAINGSSGTSNRPVEQRSENTAIFSSPMQKG
jgi:hypothetical protein